MSAPIKVPSTITLFNNSSPRGAWVMLSEAMLPHLARWPLFHRRVWEAVTQTQNGPLEGRRRKRAAHFRGKLEAIYGHRYSLENIQRAVADLVTWGFLVPVVGELTAHSGRVYLLAGIDFAPRADSDYLVTHPHFRRRIKSRAAHHEKEGGGNFMVGNGFNGTPPINPTADPPLEVAATADPRAPSPPPVTADPHGDRDNARPSFKARPNPPSPQRVSRLPQRRPKTLGGGAMDLLFKAYKSLHQRKGSPLTPHTLRRALMQARELAPGSNEQIARRLIALSEAVPEHAKHPVLWAACADPSLVVRPKRLEFAPTERVKVAPPLTETQSAELVAMGLITAPQTQKNQEIAPKIEPQRVQLPNLDRSNLAAWIEAQIS